MPTREDVLKALSACMDPELGKDIVSLGMVQNLEVAGGKVSFDYVLTTPSCPLKGRLETEARDAVMKIPGVTRADIRMKASVRPDDRLKQMDLSDVRNILAVGSGKGGVGKSTVAANIAVSLALDGAKVGLLDADIYGPNQPQMMGIGRYAPKGGPGDKLEPPTAFGVKVISMGFFMDMDSPVIWRGPMVHGAIVQLLKEIAWGELDYLVVDLPPGTGDAQLSLCQSVPVSGAVLVSTPQSIALSDVRKALSMFKSLNVPVLGIVENMAEFACPHCGKASRIFSQGGVKSLSEKHGIPLLGSVPLDPLVCETGESGSPVSASKPDSAAAKAFREITRQTASRLSVAASLRDRTELRQAA